MTNPRVEDGRAVMAGERENGLMEEADATIKTFLRQYSNFQSIFNKQGKESLFNQHTRANWLCTYKKMNLNLDLTKISTKWITDLYLKAKTLKLLEENRK